MNDTLVSLLYDGLGVKGDVSSTFASILEVMRRLAPQAEVVMRHQVIEVGSDREGVQYRIHPDRLPASHAALAAELAYLFDQEGLAGLTEMYVSFCMLAEGPKVYRPSAEDCEALEYVDPRITIADYCQPFPTMVVELPPAFQWAHTCLVRNALTGVTARTAPAAVMVHHRPDLPALFTSVPWVGGASAVRCLYPYDTLHQTNSQATIADMLHSNAEPIPHSWSMGDEETFLTERALCVALNALWLLTHYGHKELGPDNPSYATRLERYVQVAQKKQQGVEEARRAVRLLPRVYGFAQTVCLYETERQPTPAPGEATGRTLTPHWRRGHLRRQHHGVGNTLLKNVFIKPRLINAHLVAGGTGATSATYTTRNHLT